MSASSDLTGRGQGREAKPTGLIEDGKDGKREKKSTQLLRRATVLQPLANKADECEML